MKKTLLIILALCLVLSLAACGGGGSGTGAGTGTSNGVKSDHMHCVCAGKAVSVGSHTTCSDKDGWKKVGTADELIDAIATSSDEKPAYVALTADITIDSYLQVEQDQKAFVCLNGKKLNASANVIGELNIADCTGNGSVVGDKSFTIRTYAGAVVNMYAGTLTTTGSKPDTQIVVLQGPADEDKQLAEGDSVFTLYDGKIQGAGKTTKMGHCVFLGSYGVMRMYNGTVCDGYVETSDNANRYGGNIAVYGSNSLFTMYGGEVKDGNVVVPGQVDSKAGSGGNIFGNKGGICVYGGTISGGHTNGYGGNIGTNGSVSNFEFKNVVIKDGKCDGQNGGNIYVNGSAIVANFENVTISGGTSATLGANVFLNSLNAATFKDCTIKDGKITAPQAVTKTGGSAICMQGKGFLVELKGNMKFENNEQSDILTRYYDGKCSWLSIAELTTTSPILVAAAKRIELSVDTIANHPFTAVEGMAISEEDGKLIVDVAG